MLRPPESGKLNSILVDIITSAAYFDKRDIEIEQEEDCLRFIISGDCPKEYMNYLSWKYDLARGYTQ